MDTFIKQFQNKEAKILPGLESREQEEFLMKDSLSPSNSKIQKEPPQRVRGHKRYETQCPIIEEEGILAELGQVEENALPNSEIKPKLLQVKPVSDEYHSNQSSVARFGFNNLKKPTLHIPKKLSYSLSKNSHPESIKNPQILQGSNKFDISQRSMMIQVNGPHLVDGQ